MAEEYQQQQRAKSLLVSRGHTSMEENGWGSEWLSVDELVRPG